MYVVISTFLNKTLKNNGQISVNQVFTYANFLMCSEELIKSLKNQLH